MATAGDPSRPVVEPLTKEQRQRLEALQFARRLTDPGYQQHRDYLIMLRVADYIVTGAY